MDFTKTTTYTDDLGRPIQVATQNHTGGIDYSYSKIDFIGKTLQTKQVIENRFDSDGKKVSIEQTFAYDFGLRQKSICQKVDDGTSSPFWEPVARFKYDPAGKLFQKMLGCNLQTVDYNYNLAGMLKNINEFANLAGKKDFFGMKLSYSNDGNISEQNFNFAQRTGKHTDAAFRVKVSTPTFANTYNYDINSRLTQNRITAGGGTILQLNNAYDPNGNITSLTRNINGSNVDILGFDYDGNRLININESGGGDNDPSWETFKTINQASTTDYTYDNAGNMLTDANKGITANIIYNILNLPSNIGSKGVQNQYDATGRKLRSVTPSGTFDYFGGVVYKNNVVEFVSSPEGRVLPKGAVKQNARRYAPSFVMGPDTTNKFWRYEYDLKDHLGNLRVACRCAEKIESQQKLPKDGYNPIVVQQAHYDAWGVRLPLFGNPDPMQGRPEDRYKYNGKEFIASLGWYDYGARMYDPTIGRWGAVDPLSEKYHSISPYVYVANNPIKFIDPNGKEIWIGGVRYENGKLYDKNGNLYNQKMKKDGTYKGFLGKTVASLDKIRAGGKYGESLINTLQDKNFGKVLIESFGDNRTIGLNVKFNPAQSESGLNEQGKTGRPSFIGLAHELIHVKQNQNETTSYHTWYPVLDPNGQPMLDEKGKPITRKFAEISTVFEENQIRHENKIPLREYDSDKKVENQRHTNNGKSIFFFLFDSDVITPRQYDFNKDN